MRNKLKFPFTVVPGSENVPIKCDVKNNINSVLQPIKKHHLHVTNRKKTISKFRSGAHYPGKLLLYEFG